jgi:predicted ArsR family transcriptional regulator
VGRDEVIGAVSALQDPTRRALYEIVRHRQPIGRDEVAEAAELPRSTVAFHLERLVAAGLLVVVLQRRSGRTGPGAGRPAKLYSLTERELAVSLPERHYDLMADLLASAIEESGDGEPPRAALRRVAQLEGRSAGAEAGSLAAVLTEHGYDPAPEGSDTVLLNCPFHLLAARHRDLVCRANHAFLSGAADATGNDPSTVVLEPSAGSCCVRILGVGRLG